MKHKNIFLSFFQVKLVKMAGLHCELEHINAAAVINIMLLRFFKRDTFRAVDWVFLLSSKEYFVLHSICSSIRTTLGTGNSSVSMTKTWIMD